MIVIRTYIVLLNHIKLPGIWGKILKKIMG